MNGFSGSSKNEKMVRLIKNREKILIRGFFDFSTKGRKL